MEHYGRRNLRTFIDEEKRATQSPTRHLSINQTLEEMSELQDAHFSPSRTPNAASPLYSLMAPPSPDSPWTLSPLLQTPSPSPSLLHHCIATLHRQEGNIHSIAVSKGIVFTGSDSSRIRAWWQPDCMERGHVKAARGGVRSMLAYGNTLFTSHSDFKVRIWNITTGWNTSFKPKKVVTLPKRKSRASPLSLLFPTTRITTSSSITNQQPHKECVSCMAYYHAEGLLYTGSWDKTVKSWCVSDARCVDTFIAHEDNVNSIVVNQEDGCVFTCSSDGSVRIWRRVYGQRSHTLTMTLKFQPSPVNALALSKSLDGCFLYSGSSDGFVNFWEKEKICSRFNHGGFLQGHRFAVLSLAAVEKLVFSGSEDTTVRVWRREEGSCFHECLAVLDAHRGPVRCLAASLEIIGRFEMGVLVYSASLDQTFKVWRVKVLPGDDGGDEKKKIWLEDKLDSEDTMRVKNNNNGEYGMSPVLSPSWVEKKLQGSHPFL